MPSVTTTWRSAVAVAACVVLYTAASGCEFKGSRPIFVPPVAPEGLWQPRPVSMRVYPASRFVADQQSQRIVLEARIELLDDMGDAIKGVGTFQFELLGTPGQGRTLLDRGLYTWEVPVLNLEQQHLRYDKITRTYLFRLKMDEPFAPTTDTTLKVWFVESGGYRFEAETVMPGREQNE